MAVGPGLGTQEQTASALRDLLQHADAPLVLDARCA